MTLIKLKEFDLCKKDAGLSIFINPNHVDSVNPDPRYEKDACFINIGKRFFLVYGSAEEVALFINRNTEKP